MEIEEGQIWQRSWGYNQTQVDFVRVEEISDTGKTVVCQRIGKERTEDGVVPDEGAEMYDTFRLHVREGDSRLMLRGSYPMSEDRDFDPSTFFKWKGEPCYETPPQLGH